MNVSTTTKRRAGSAVAVAVSMSLAFGATAHATPEQGGTAPSGPSEQGGTAPSGPSEQGGTAPSGPSEQGGTTPAPAPAPGPNYDPGPGLVPGPPPGNYAPAPQTQTTPQTDYNPIPQGPLHAPRPTPPVKRIAPPPDHVRIGNAVIAVKDLPNLPVKKKDRDKAIVSINEWAAYGEAEIARGLISIGVPEDEASRQAAATIIGIAAGGGIGFTVGFGTTAIVTGPVIIPVATGIGCGVGAAFGGNPLTILNGCGGGALVGLGVTAGVSTGVGVLTAIAGGIGGGALAWALGAGDKEAHPKRPGMPDLMPSPKHQKPEVIRIVNPEANQFEAHVPSSVAKNAGLPAVDYVVNKRGDVQLDVGNAHVGWTAEQGQAPMRALESVVPGAGRAINDGVRTVTRELSKAVPAIDIQWPQEAPKSKSGPRHAH